MKKAKKINFVVAFMIAFLCIFNECTIKAADNKIVRVFLNGTELAYDVPAKLINNRTMVPISQTIQALTGSEASYNAFDRTLSFEYNDKTVVHRIGDSRVIINGAAIDYDTPSVIIDDRTLVPLRMLTDSTDCSVIWDPVNFIVLVTAPSKPVPSQTGKPALASEYEPPVILSVSSDNISLNQGDKLNITVTANSSTKKIKLSTNANLMIEEITKYTVKDGKNVFTISTDKVDYSGKYRIYPGFENLYENMTYKEIIVDVAMLPSIITSIIPTASFFTQNTAAEFIVFASADTSRVKAVIEKDQITAESTIFTVSGSSRIFKVKIIPKTSGVQGVKFYAGTNSMYSSSARIESIDVMPAPPISIKETIPVDSVAFNTPFNIGVVTSASAVKVWLSAQGSGMADSAIITEGFTDTLVNGEVRRTWQVPWTVSAVQTDEIAATVNASDITGSTVTSAITLKVSNPDPIIHSAEYTLISNSTDHQLEIVTNASVSYIKYKIFPNYIDGIPLNVYPNPNWEFLLTEYYTEDSGRQLRWKLQNPPGIYVQIGNKTHYIASAIEITAGNKVGKTSSRVIVIDANNISNR